MMRLHTAIAALVLALAGAGCSAIGPRFQPAPAPEDANLATVYLFRPDKIIPNAVNLEITMNGTTVAYLLNNGYTALYVNPGNLIFYTTSFDAPGVFIGGDPFLLQARAGERHYVKVDPQLSFFHYDVKFFEYDEITAQRQIASARYEPPEPISGEDPRPLLQPPPPLYHPARPLLPPVSPPQDPKQAMVYLFRPDKPFAGSVNLEITMNGRTVTYLRDNDFRILYVDPGSLVIDTTNFDSPGAFVVADPFFIDAKPGERYYVKVNLEFGLYIEVEFSEMEETTALREIAEARSAKPRVE